MVHDHGKIEPDWRSGRYEAGSFRLPNKWRDISSDFFSFFEFKSGLSLLLWIKSQIIVKVTSQNFVIIISLENKSWIPIYIK